jgi:ABC-type branched-subunit amino acid transport system ATPase component/ABC-type branched-subunit amino acid transport system permease subunit
VSVVAFEIPIEVFTLGVVTGLTYAILAAGLVLVYKTTRVLNFAHGEMGALPALLVPLLVRNYEWNYWVATLLALVLAVAIGAAMELGIMRRLSTAPRLLVLVATIGVAQLVAVVIELIPREGGRNRFSLGYPVPFDLHVTIGSLRLNTGELLIIAVVPLLALALAAFFRFTRMGLAGRAVADNENVSQLNGVPVRRVALVVWILAAVFAAASAMLISPTRPTGAASLGPTLMLRALAAAMVGSLTNIPVAFAAGVVLGTVEVVLLWNYATAGLMDVVLLGVIVAVLLLGRVQRARAGAGEASSWSLAGTVARLQPWQARARETRLLHAGSITAGLLLAVGIPHVLPIGDVVLLSGAALYAVMGLSLTVLTGYAGQLSVGQFSFVAIGAAVGGRMLQLGYPYWVGVVYAVAAGGVAALVIGLPALRVRGIYLAVTTLGFAVAVEAWLTRQSWFVHTNRLGETSLSIPRPRFLGIDFDDERSYYYLCLALMVLVAAGVWQLARTGAGRLMMAVRDNEEQAAALGVRTRRVKVMSFAFSGMIAGLAGFFYGGLFVNFTAGGFFAPQLSLVLLGMAMIGGITTVSGAIFGAVFLRLGAKYVAELLPLEHAGVALIILGGAGLLIAVVQFPGGIASQVFGFRDKILARLLGPPPVDAVADAAQEELDDVVRTRLEPPATPPGDDEVEVSGPVLRAEDVVVRFGGNVVLGGVTLDATAGEIVGVLGPNGAGKTTLFDVLSGFVEADRGRVLIQGIDATRLRPEARADLGLGRTFQQARLFPDMPLADALKVSLERHDRSELVPSLFALPPSRHAEQAKSIEVVELLELVGLERSAHLRVSELSTGMRRLAELAALVGVGARVLLLDEPTAGIAQREVEAFSPVLRQIRDHLDATVVLIEHDIPLVMGLSDRVYVLAAGEVLAEGLPDDVRADDRVIAAYLGTDQRVIQRSGART